MGKAKEMEITSIDKSSSISLAESSDGSGGVEVAIVLKRASKGNLECVFNNGLQQFAAKLILDTIHLTVSVICNSIIIKLFLCGLWILWPRLMKYFDNIFIITSLCILNIIHVEHKLVFRKTLK